MKKTVFLHIGTNKTGTTTIQNFCAKNEELLRDVGFLYPKTGRSGNAHYDISGILGFKHTPFKDVDNKKISILKKNFNAEINSAKCDFIMVSSEFFMLPKEIFLVKEFFSDFLVKIVIYLRRHDSWWESSYSQAIKTVETPPWGSNFEEYLFYHDKINPRWGNYLLLLRQWSEVFGMDNIIVRPYESQQNQPNIIYDFLKSIGCPNLSFLEFPSRRDNTSLSFKAMQLVDTYQRLNIDTGLKRKLVNFVIENDDGEKSRHFSDPLLRRKLIKDHQDEYKTIARDFLGREDGVLFYDPLPDIEGWEEPKTLTKVELLDETFKILSDHPEILKD